MIQVGCFVSQVVKCLHPTRRIAPAPSFTEPRHDGSKDHLPLSDCIIVKTHLLNVLVGAPPPVQAELSEALAAAATYDFPTKWTTILPSIVNSLEDAALHKGEVDKWDLAETKSLLVAALSLFSRFRSSLEKEDAFDESEKEDVTRYIPDADHQYCAGEFATCLRELTRGLQDAKTMVYQCLRLCCEIFYSLRTMI